MHASTDCRSSKSFVLKAKDIVKKALSECDFADYDFDGLLATLSALESCDVTLELLRTTKIGVAVNQLSAKWERTSERSLDEELVVEMCKSLVAKWKKIAHYKEKTGVRTAKRTLQQSIQSDVSRSSSSSSVPSGLSAKRTRSSGLPTPGSSLTATTEKKMYMCAQTNTSNLYSSFGLDSPQKKTKSNFYRLKSKGLSAEGGCVPALVNICCDVMKVNPKSISYCPVQLNQSTIDYIFGESTFDELEAVLKTNAHWQSAVDHLYKSFAIELGECKKPKHVSWRKFYKQQKELRVGRAKKAQLAMKHLNRRGAKKSKGRNRIVSVEQRLVSARSAAHGRGKLRKRTIHAVESVGLAMQCSRNGGYGALYVSRSTAQKKRESALRESQKRKERTKRHSRMRAEMFAGRKLPTASKSVSMEEWAKSQRRKVRRSKNESCL